MAIITISRQLGTGEIEFTDKLTDTLGYPLYDDRLIQQVAAELEVHTGVVRAYDERLEPSAIQSVLSRITGGNVRRQLSKRREEGGVRPEIVRTALRSVVREIARHEDAIIVGRGASIILSNLRRVLKLRLVAPVDFRAREHARTIGMNLGEAEETVRRSDSDRGNSIRRMFNVDWNDPTLYDVVINMARTDRDTAVRIVSRIMEEKQL
ncbi:MAG: cytidylate kinase-like family protein [Chloroflexota bacterium]|nr:cytidylate kinase-like family protein [Chloroflexota bacterium]MDE2840615.1 cytidylate kinase-like family protein [Chloroflexota bacterium]MDE2931447.1 cytidylate kinase-like family protein [Chloroflexota bacterium]